MRELSLLDRDLMAEVNRRQGQLWDQLLGWLIDRVDEPSDIQGPFEPAITDDDLDRDLWFGRT